MTQQSWGRSDGSITVLEWTPLESRAALDSVDEKALGIFRYSIGPSAARVIGTVLSELRSNVVDHAEDPRGALLIADLLG